MDYSCCICGLVLAPEDGDFPLWCKDIRAICWFQSQPILSGRGSIDYDLSTFSLPIPSFGLRRFQYARVPENKSQHFCYPFHNSCWVLLQESHVSHSLQPDIVVLFSLFESIHCWDRALRWGHTYFLEDMLISCNNHEDTISAHKADEAILADPLYLDLPRQAPIQQLTYSHPPLSLSKRGSTSSTAILNLPIEIFQSILYILDFCDVQHLIQAIKMPYKPSSSFWESRFWPTGETGFARSIRPPSYSWKDWFFTVQSETRASSNNMNLQNRKRIWRLVVNLSTLINTVSNPIRVLRGGLATTVLDQMRGSIASCLAQKHNSEGCRELKQIFVPLKNRICSVISSYCLVLNRRLICGLTFTLHDIGPISIGYVSRNYRGYHSYEKFGKFLWLVCSPQGFESVSVEYPHNFIDTCTYLNKVGIARWKLESIRGVCVGLDSMRIVRICCDAQEQNSLDDILWSVPYPSHTPTMCLDDITTLHTFQKGSFTPASTLSIEPENGRLIAIKTYSPLSFNSGITGIVLVYDTGKESVWGSIVEAASLVFFLDETEYITKVDVYKKGSLTCHLKFITNLHRISDSFPPLLTCPDSQLECFTFEASNQGHIDGFVGCFMGRTNQLHCFGIMAKTPTTSLKPVCLPPKDTSSINALDTPLGGIKNHGQYQSHLRLRKRYKSVQASVNYVVSNYRRAGQVTGLVLYSDEVHPDILGQYTGLGYSYDLEEGEEIVDLHVTTIKPIRPQYSRPGLSQVESVVLVTSRRCISWGPTATKVLATEFASTDRKIREVVWEFNAIFDRVTCIY